MKLLFVNNYKKYLINKIGVYCLLNNITGDCYVGSSINLYNRLRQHKNSLYKSCHENQILNRSVSKYGIDNFSFKILKYIFIIDKEILSKKEQYYIDILNPKYNILKDAYRNSSYKHTKEAKEKIRISGIGRITNNVSIIQYDKNNNIIKEWNSIISASKELHINKANIGITCKFYTNIYTIKRPTAGGFIWKYKDKEN